MKKESCFFGDSNTWGCIPVESIAPTTRYPAKAILGEEYLILEEGLSGRTANSDDPDFTVIKGAGLNGAKYLSPLLATHMPFDMAVITLGTNDVKQLFGLTTLEISLNILNLAAGVKRILS